MGIPAWLTEKPEGIIVRLHIQPNARRSQVTGEHGDRLKIRIAAPPVDGAANEEIIRFLGETLQVPRSRLQIIRGETSRAKDVLVAQISASAVLTALIQIKS